MSEHPNLWVVFVSDEPEKLCPRTFREREAAVRCIESWKEDNDGVTYELVEYAPIAEAHRRGAIEALRSVYETVASAMERQDGPEFATLDMVLTWLMDVRARYEKPEEAK